MLACGRNLLNMLYILSMFPTVNSWKLSRTQSLPLAAEPLINNAINNVQVLDQQYFVVEGQSEDDCFFYPDNEGGDVVLNGQCLPDSQVPAVSDFNVNLVSIVYNFFSLLLFPDVASLMQVAMSRFPITII